MLKGPTKIKCFPTIVLVTIKNLLSFSTLFAVLISYPATNGLDPTKDETIIVAGNMKGEILSEENMQRIEGDTDNTSELSRGQQTSASSIVNEKGSSNIKDSGSDVEDEDNRNGPDDPE